MLHPQSALEAVQRHPHASPIPVVADANVLIKDVCANLRRSAPTALFGLLVSGRIRLLITDRVAHEVPTRMHRVARRSVDRALWLWNERYLPLIRVVAVSDVAPESEIDVLLGGVRAQDLDDLPTAYLGLLCAPCAVITEDRDLLDHGFGAPEWVSALRASGKLGDLDQVLFYGANATSALIEGSAVGLFRLARRMAGSPVAAGFVLALVLFGLTDGRPHASAQIERSKPTAARILDGLGRFVEGVAAQRGALLSELGPCTLAPLSARPLAARLAARLATSADPLSIAELARLEGHEEDEVRALLRAHPAFEVVRGRGWQIGCVENVAIWPTTPS
jgi:hypothetical protein